MQEPILSALLSPPFLFLMPLQIPWNFLFPPACTDSNTSFNLRAQAPPFLSPPHTLSLHTLLPPSSHPHTLH